MRPAVVVSPSGEKYDDIFIVPMTSRLANLQAGEFELQQYSDYGLNVPTAIKRGCVLIDSSLILKRIGKLDAANMKKVGDSLCLWQGLEYSFPDTDTM